MTAGMNIGVRRVLLAIAVLTVLFGLVGMHQLAATAASSHPGVGTEHSKSAERGHQPGLPAPTEPQPRDDHSTLLHLCLAVVAAIGMLLTSRVLLIVTASTATLWASRRFSRAHTGPRAPPAPSARRLAELCVLRR